MCNRQASAVPWELSVLEDRVRRHERTSGHEVYVNESEVYARCEKCERSLFAFTVTFPSAPTVHVGYLDREGLIHEVGHYW